MEQPQSKPRPPEVHLHLLADPRRRRVLEYLVDRPYEPVDLPDLAEHVHAIATPNANDPTGRETIEVSLHHTHLPKLAETGAVTYDPENRVVRYQPDAVVERLLRATVGRFD